MFRTVPLSIIRSFSLYTQHWHMSYMFAASLQTVHKLVRRIPLLVVQWKTHDGQRNSPKHVEFHSKIKKCWEMSTSSWFYYKKFITMHGHINVKCVIQSEYPEGISVEATDVPCFYNLKLWMFCGWKEKLQMLHWQYGIRLSKGLWSFLCHVPVWGSGDTSGLLL